MVGTDMIVGESDGCAHWRGRDVHVCVELWMASDGGRVFGGECVGEERCS